MSDSNIKRAEYWVDKLEKILAADTTEQSAQLMFEEFTNCLDEPRDVGSFMGAIFGMLLSQRRTLQRIDLQNEILRKPMGNIINASLIDYSKM